jgi:hypothetical protein
MFFACESASSCEGPRAGDKPGSALAEGHPQGRGVDAGEKRRMIDGDDAVWFNR